MAHFCGLHVQDVEAIFQHSLHHGWIRCALLKEMIIALFHNDNSFIPQVATYYTFLLGSISLTNFQFNKNRNLVAYSYSYSIVVGILFNVNLN